MVYKVYKFVGIFQIALVLLIVAGLCGKSRGFGYNNSGCVPIITTPKGFTTCCKEICRCTGVYSKTGNTTEENNYKIVLYGINVFKKDCKNMPVEDFQVTVVLTIMNATDHDEQFIFHGEALPESAKANFNVQCVSRTSWNVDDIKKILMVQVFIYFKLAKADPIALLGHLAYQACTKCGQSSIFDVGCHG